MEKYSENVKSIDSLFTRLFSNFESQKLLLREEVPTYAGIYVFYKLEKPIYVGRADNIRHRIQLHTRPSAGSESANFAFNLAKIEFAEKLSESMIGRKELMKDPKFIEIFSRNKADLSASKIRCIEINDVIIQTMFEPFLSFKLGTYPQYNKFKNH